MPDLDDAWRRTARDAGATADDEALSAVATDLLTRWREPHRHYHDDEHLTEVLTAVDELAADGGAADADLSAVRLAAWFHDAIYEGRPGDDEERSAELARSTLVELGVDVERAERVAALVRVTLHHDPTPGDAEAALLCDADLAVLAAGPERYTRYVNAVRQEYGHVPEPMFRSGRALVLKALEAMPRLYRTQVGRARWENAARANLAQELSELES